MSSSERVVLVGASDKPERYAHQALLQLRAHGHTVVPVHPRLSTVEGLPVTATLAEVSSPVGTVTLYVGPAISAGLTADLLRLRPRRVIFNPGTENPGLQAHLEAAGIAAEEACTLVLLRTGQF